jgi:hypothetical protein
MVQNSEVLIGEDNRISLISARRIAAQKDYLAVAERAMGVTGATWTFEVGDRHRVTRTTPRLANTIVKIANWLGHLGSGKISDGYLESRHNIHHDFKTNGIRL